VEFAEGFHHTSSNWISWVQTIKEITGMEQEVRFLFERVFNYGVEGVHEIFFSFITSGLKFNGRDV
jgi:hypothetical protein